MLKGKSYFIKLGSCFHGLAVIPFIKNNIVFADLIAEIWEQSKKTQAVRRSDKFYIKTKQAKLIWKATGKIIALTLLSRLVDMTITVGQKLFPATSGVREIKFKYHSFHYNDQSQRCLLFPHYVMGWHICILLEDWWRANIRSGWSYRETSTDAANGAWI